MKLRILALVLGCVLLLSGCTNVISATETDTPKTTEPAKSQIGVQDMSTEKPAEPKPKRTPPLEAVKTKEKYAKIAENFTGQYYYDYDGAMGVSEFEMAVPAPVVEEAADSMANNNIQSAAPSKSSDVAAEAGTEANSNYSETNVQVAGVDEADLIKTDGKFIFYCMDDTLFIVETDDTGIMKSVMSQTYSNFNPIEMYLDETRLVVIGSDRNTRNKSFTDVIRDRISGGYTYVEPYTTIKIYERLKDGKIELSRTVSLDGGYLTSRKIGQSVYVITDSWRYNNVIPFYIDSAVSSREYDVPLDCMYVMPDYTNNSIMMVATIDLSDSTKKVDIQSFVGSADIIYMSKESLYVSFTRWFDDGYGTKIYRFALESDYVTYESDGSVKGQLLNQFSMDEYEGYLRVAVTGISTENMSSNAVYILDKNLKEVSKIDKIAPGERIYSVRFMGGRGYVVTFRQTDPLFAFDLSDPKNPKLLGALKIPGYSTYLHPYDENHLIGFGQDTVETKNGAVLSTGIKISMFDVTDLTNPKEMFVTYIGDRGSSSPLLSNHKAILQNTAKNIFAFPAAEYRVTGYKDEWTYGNFYQQGAFVYNIDMSKGFELRGVVTHKSDEEILKSGMYYSNYDTDVERIIYIGDYFYTVSRSKIQSNEIKSLKTVSQLTVGKALR